jgi:hypothetical protein
VPQLARCLRHRVRRREGARDCDQSKPFTDPQLGFHIVSSRFSFFCRWPVAVAKNE